MIEFYHRSFGCPYFVEVVKIINVASTELPKFNVKYPAFYQFPVAEECLVILRSDNFKKSSYGIAGEFFVLLFFTHSTKTN